MIPATKGRLHRTVVLGIAFLAIAVALVFIGRAASRTVEPSATKTSTTAAASLSTPTGKNSQSATSVLGATTNQNTSLPLSATREFLQPATTVTRSEQTGKATKPKVAPSTSTGSTGPTVAQQTTTTKQPKTETVASRRSAAVPEPIATSPSSIAPSRPTGPAIGEGPVSASVPAEWQLAFTLPTPDSWTSDVSWSPDGRLVATAGGDGLVRIWRTADGALVRTFGDGILSKPSPNLFTFSESIFDVEWGPDSRHLAVAGSTPIVSVWDAESGAKTMTLDTGAAGVYSVDWSIEGARIVTGGAAGKVVLWDASNGQVISSRMFEGSVWSVAVAPNSATIAIAAGPSVEILETETLTSKAVLRNPIGVVLSVSWSGDGSRLATGGKALQTWDPSIGTLQKTTVDLSKTNAMIREVQWSPDGLRIAAAFEEGGGRILDAIGTQKPFKYDERTGANGLAWSPDGQSIAIAGLKRTAILVAR